jgi:tetratricopeptide (TPR) repeat protein
MGEIIVGNGRPRRRTARTVLGIGLGVAISLVVGYGVFVHLTRIEPPEGMSASHHQPVEVHGARAAVGESWVSRERGIWEYHLSGAPFEMGYAHTRLGNRLLMETDEYMFAEMRRYVPSPVARFLIRNGVRLRYRGLPAHILPDQLQEIAGMSQGYLDLHTDFLPTFHRMVFYHALHDITQGLERSPLLGCTAFAATGQATQSGHLIIGRNFDFEGPPIFDKEKAVLFFRPRGKLPFASVAWTGMIGAVTGLNTEGIYVSINAARTEDKGQRGVPVELLLREVLEGAHNLQEAIDIIRKRPVLVPDFYLVGDGKSGEAAVIERSPTRFEVRHSKDARDTLALTNHGLSKSFTGDKENERLRTYLTSGARLARLQELLDQYRGALDPRKALEILRDKRGVGGEALGLGNRNAIDALIATHSVVVDATSLILWVGIGPHALGRYVPFDLRKELLGEDRPAPLDFPEDTVLTSEDYRAYLQAQAAMEHAQEMRRIGELDRAIEEAGKAEALQPSMPEAHRLLADLLRQRGDAGRGDRDRARRHYQRFLEVHPPYLADIEEVRKILQAL